MSQLKNALKARFRGSSHDKKSDNQENKDQYHTKVRKRSHSAGSNKDRSPRKSVLSEHQTDEEAFELVSSYCKDNDEPSFSSSVCLTPEMHTPPGIDEMPFRDDDEKIVYEEQMSRLQEQLVNVMIENQSYSKELQEYRSTVCLDRLKQELEYERKRNRSLEHKLATIEKKRDRKVQRSKSDASRRAPSPEAETGIEPSEIDGSNWDKIAEPSMKKHGLWDRFWERLLDFIYGTIDDFTEVPLPKKIEDREGDPLTAKKLKENLKRFGAGAKPYFNTAKGLYNLMTWKSPAYTMVIFMMYMYSVWKGFLLSLILFLITFKLFINFLRYHRLNIEFNFLDPGEEEEADPESKDMGVSDKFNLVLHVARKVQNTLGDIADNLEKIKSLLTWRYPPATKQIFLAACLGFIASCVFPTPYLFYIAGLYAGIKLFIVNFFYNKYPRLKLKYDSTYQMWLALPTDSQYVKRHAESEIDKYILVNCSEEANEEPPFPVPDQLSSDDKSFCELFSLPHSECPITGWQTGRRCTLINRDKSLTSAFKNGKIYLTQSFLCFERNKNPSRKNIVIPLSDISKLEKAKPYSLLPGRGMAIEITLAGSEKSFVFGGILNRDEVFQSIVDVGIQKRLSWATGVPQVSPSPRLQHGGGYTNKSNTGTIQNFSFAGDYEDSD
ncbi:hypothetical protein ScPMuIL_009531 [Solemya velum]